MKSIDIKTLLDVVARSRAETNGAFAERPLGCYTQRVNTYLAKMSVGEAPTEINAENLAKVLDIFDAGRTTGLAYLDVYTTGTEMREDFRILMQEAKHTHPALLREIGYTV